MARNPLDILRKDLNTLKQHVQSCKTKFKAQLKWKKKLTEVDKHWLDNEGNIVDEQCVLKTLEAASDYRGGIERLNDTNKGIVQWL